MGIAILVFQMSMKGHLAIAIAAAEDVPRSSPEGCKYQLHTLDHLLLSISHISRASPHKYCRSWMPQVSLNIVRVIRRPCDTVREGHKLGSWGTTAMAIC
jgi:hypothetical protein